MRRWWITWCAVLAAVICGRANEPLTFRQMTALDRSVIEAAMERAKTFQEAQHDGPVPTNWLTGALYTGVYACYQATGNDAYLAAARDWCTAAGWRCGDRRPLHADDICSAQTFLDLYLHDRDPSQIAHIRGLLDTYYFGQETIDRRLIGDATWHEASRPFTGRNLWWWCDALYMAPPLFARLGAATGEQKYYDLLHRLYWDAVEYLYDPEECLFYRDDRFFDARTPSGKKVFWSRGNGWVVGGLVRTLDYLPADDPMRPRYLQLFRDMMRRLVALQGDDGLWRSSVNDPDWLPEPESSASAFYCFGLAAGINRGWLDERAYLPHLVRAWEGLLGCLRADGKLEWAQLVDDQPRRVRHEDHKNYAQGAFLLAAAEMHRMEATPERYAGATGDRRVVTLAEDGGWTWYNDERAVFWNRHLLVGHVTGDGRSAVSAYLLPGQDHSVRRLAVPLSTWTQPDDHNNPALLPLDRDRLLAAYARHNTHREFHTRVLRRDFAAGPERTVAHPAPLTYANLFRLAAEDGRIYNFFRGAGWNPNLVTSDDNGDSWSDPIQLIVSGDARQRPYVKYAGDGAGRIDLLYTDGHPRDVPTNRVYHLYYTEGIFHRSDGAPVRGLDALRQTPLVPEDGTLIYDGAGPAGRGWVHDLERNARGELAAVYITSPDGDAGLDLRYRYARFHPDTRQWTEGEIAHAGPHLYAPENHYAGGICIDPDDLDTVYLSAALDPADGTPNGTGHWQIYRGTTPDRGRTWQFEPLTFDLVRDNIRPFVPRGRPAGLTECVLWFRGTYRTYTDYSGEIAGVVR